MITKDEKSINEYKDAAKTFDAVIIGSLFEGSNSNELNLVITRNFIAKSVMIVRSIYKLWEINAFQECHILNRCLIDRLFYLHRLHSTDGFEDFEEWSFVESYDLFARLRADPRFKVQIDASAPVPEDQTKRRADLRKKTLAWQIPSPQEIAREMNKEYLYLYGYDYASMHVHPLAFDGRQDFEIITGLRSGFEFPTHEIALHNALLILWLIFRDSIDALKGSFSSELNQFMLDFFEFLETGSSDYILSFGTLFQIWDKKPWVRL
jgi:hypothetical protein